MRHVSEDNVNRLGMYRKIMFTDQACIGGVADIEDNAGNDFCSRKSRKQQETESRKGKQKTLKSKIKIYEYCLFLQVANS